MSTKIEYTDIFGVPITTQQRSALIDFKKFTFVLNEIKIIETFQTFGSGSHRSVDYFIDASESKQEIIQKYVDVATKSSLVIYSNKQQSNGFNLWDWESYGKSSQVTFKGKEVFDNKLRTIFSCAFDQSTNLLLADAQKIYYGNQVVSPYDDRLLEFKYDANGNVKLIFDSNENYGYIKSISLAEFLDDTEFSQVDFPWDQHPYYHSVLPYLPEGNL